MTGLVIQPINRPFSPANIYLSSFCLLCFIPMFLQPGSRRILILIIIIVPAEGTKVPSAGTIIVYWKLLSIHHRYG